MSFFANISLVPLKYIAAIVPFFFLFISVIAKAGEGFNAKIILGFNAAQIDGDRSWGYNKFGLVGGASVNFKIADKVYLQQEIYYSGKGAATGRNQPYFISTRIHYIDFPVILHYKIKKKWTLEGGLTPAYMISGKMDDTGYGYYDITKYLKKYDLAFSLGGEYVFDDNWAINARFNYSLLSITKPIASTSFVYSGWLNNFFNFTLRYSFLRSINKKNQHVEKSD